MSDSILEKYRSKHILAVYNGEDAWKKYIPIRWPQVSVRAAVRRRFKKTNMGKSIMIIYVTPKIGSPDKIYVHFYPDITIPDITDININIESDYLWIIEAPYSALEFDDAPKLLKKLVLYKKFEPSI